MSEGFLRRAAHARPLDRCALLGAAALGGVVGLTIGGAYLAGGMARAAVVHAQISRLADAAAKDGFSDAALAASQSEDPGALSIARRLDPYNAADFDPHVRAVALLSRLENRSPSAALMKASFNRPSPSEALAGGPEEPALAGGRARGLRGALDETRDLECLTEAVYYEARGETAAGQAAVAQVVLNRTRSPAFPKSVCGVVYQGSKTSGCQFSFACDGSTRRRVENKAWRRAEKVAARALDGYVMPEVGQATHFHVAGVSPDWKTRLLRVAQVGAHVFYRFGRDARPAPFTPQAPEPIPTANPNEAKPVYASLSLAPVANAVATGAANAVTAGAGLVMAATGVKTAQPLEAGKEAKPQGQTATVPAKAPAAQAIAVVPAVAAPPKPVAILEAPKVPAAS